MWLEYFEGALVPLTAYNFLDGCIATLPHLAQFTCTPRVPTCPFLHITPSPIEEPL
jgi:hypothetical protein